MKSYPRLIAGLVAFICLAIVIPAASFAASSSEDSTSKPLLSPLGDEAAPAVEVGADCRTASETGFDICDDANARFLSAYQSYGLQNVGYPISIRYQRDGFITQAFQKAVLQWRPDTGTIAFKNIFDELSKQSLDQRLFSSRQTPYPLPAGWDGEIPFDQVIQKRQALLTRPALRAKYFAASDPLTFFGLPNSEVVDMGNHYAIRMQRAVLQEWKETVPWAAAGEVTIANGGDIAKEMAFLPAFALTSHGAPAASAPTAPVAAPGSTGSTASTGPARKLDPRLDALGVKIEEADVAPGQPYWRAVEVMWHDEDEAGGRHHIYVDVQDENGVNLAGKAIKFFWDGGEEVKPSSSNFPMYAAGHSYNVEIGGLPSDVVRGMGLGSIEQRRWNIHVEYFVKFRMAIKGAAPTSAAIPTTAPSAPAAPTTAPSAPVATPVPSAPAASSGAARNLDSRLGALGVSIEDANVAPGQPYWRVIEVLWHDESQAGGRHSIFVDVLDENGGKVVGHPVKYSWGGGQEILLTEDKPAHEYNSNFPMYAAGQSYHLQVEGLPSDIVHGMGLGDLQKRDWNIHVEYLVKFQRAIK
jgi:hypothetical protein